MTRNIFLMTTSLILTAFVSVFTLFVNGEEPSLDFDKLITQALAKSDNIDAVGDLVNKIMRAQNLDAASKAFEASKSQENLPPESAELIAFCYYDLKLQAALRKPSEEAFAAFVEDFLNDVRDCDACANISLRVCRNLSYYAPELAKQLHLQLIDLFVASEFVERRNAIHYLLRSILTPMAPSDSTLEPTLLQFERERETVDSANQTIEVDTAIRKLARLEALYNAYASAHPIHAATGPEEWNQLFPAPNRIAQFEELRAPYDIVFSASGLSNQHYYQTIKNGWGRTPTSVGQSALEHDPAVIQNLIHVMKGYPSNSKLAAYGAKLFDSLFQAYNLQASLEGGDAFERLPEQYASAVELDATYALDSAVRAVGDLKQIDERLYNRFISILRESDDPKVVETADRIEGAFRFKDLVGQEAVLEGVCDDGSRITLEDYRGKSILLHLSYTLPEPPEPYLSIFNKYHDAGLEVVMYVPQLDAGVSSNMKPVKAPFRRISRLRTRANPELSGKAYVDLANYYGLSERIYPKIVLIDPEGKVVATNLTTQDFEEELKKLYPNVK